MPMGLYKPVLFEVYKKLSLRFGKTMDLGYYGTPGYFPRSRGVIILPDFNNIAEKIKLKTRPEAAEEIFLSSKNRLMHVHMATNPYGGRSEIKKDDYSDFVIIRFVPQDVFVVYARKPKSRVFERLAVYTKEYPPHIKFLPGAFEIEGLSAVISVIPFGTYEWSELDKFL